MEYGIYIHMVSGQNIHRYLFYIYIIYLSIINSQDTENDASSIANAPRRCLCVGLPSRNTPAITQSLGQPEMPWTTKSTPDSLHIADLAHRNGEKHRHGNFAQPQLDIWSYGSSRGSLLTFKVYTHIYINYIHIHIYIYTLYIYIYWCITHRQVCIYICMAYMYVYYTYTHILYYIHT